MFHRREDGTWKVAVDYLSKDAIFMFGEYMPRRLRSADGYMLFQAKYSNGNINIFKN
jgi:hypothetical protein